MNRVVVADAGPLHYLVLIDCAGLLPQLFAAVLIPPVVRDELLRQSTPQKVKDWITSPPPWLKIEPVSRFHPVAHLHPGEAAALQLALEMKTAVVLMDDLDGRAASRQLRLAVVARAAIAIQNHRLVTGRRKWRDLNST
jgi:predicted nucleic acid-binding protein